MCIRDSGISVPAEDIDAIAKSIIKIKKLAKQERDEMGKRGKEFVIKNHDYKILAKKFLDSLNL